MDLTQASGERITHSGVLINGTLYITVVPPGQRRVRGRRPVVALQPRLQGWLGAG